MIKVNNVGDKYEVIAKDKIRFIGYSQILTRKPDEVRYGGVKNTYKPIVYGVGYYGFDSVREVKNKNKEYKRIYDIWKDMLRRCYTDNTTSYNKRDVKVDVEWHSFANFYKWCLNLTLSNYRKDFYLDKDILKRNNTLYSPKLCVFVPKRINNLLVGMNDGNVNKCIRHTNRNYQVLITKKKKFIGGYNTLREARIAYKIAKEEYIRVHSYLSYMRDEIPYRVYESLVKFKINEDIDEYSYNKKEFIKSNQYLERFILSLQELERSQTRQLCGDMQQE